ncbi:hypothetical protein IMSHALPRED_009726, partial [Imshaugia aleurites]
MYTGVRTGYAESRQRMLQILAESGSNNLNMVFNGTTLNNAFFRKHELQVAAALYLYCQNADGSYADAELIGEIIKDMRGAAGPAPPCRAIETLLRDSPNHHMREAWREVVDNDMEWREKASTAYWTWRHGKKEIIERLAKQEVLARVTTSEG